MRLENAGNYGKSWHKHIREFTQETSFWHETEIYPESAGLVDLDRMLTRAYNNFDYATSMHLED